MALQMDLYDMEVEIAEPRETRGWMGLLRKVRMELDEPYQAEGSKNIPDGKFFQAVCKLRLIFICVTRTQGDTETWEYGNKALSNFPSPGISLFSFKLCS